MRDVTYMQRYGTVMPVPHMDPQHYSTYMVRRPWLTHSRPATCEEYHCDSYIHGFVTTVYLDTDLGQRQWEFLTHDKTRSYHIQRPSMNIAKFVYGPGNMCFNMDTHRVYNTRPPKLLVVGGDWRGNPNNFVRQHTQIEHWVEDFAINQANIAREIQKG